MKPLYIYFNEETQKFTVFEQGATISDEAGVCVAKGVSEDFVKGFLSANSLPYIVPTFSDVLGAEHVMDAIQYYNAAVALTIKRAE